MPESRAKLLVNFAIVYLVWGSTYLAISYGITTIPPFIFGAARFLVAGTVMFAWSMFRGGTRPTRLHWRNTSVIGILLLAGGNGGVIWAEQTVPSGVTALLVAIVPLWMVVIDWLRPRGVRPTTRVITGVMVGLVGMAVLVGFDSFRGTGGIPLTSALVLICASASWAGGSIYAKHVQLPSSGTTSGMEMLAGGAALIIIAAISGEFRAFDVATVSRVSALSLLYLIVFGSIVAFSAYTWLVKHTSPAAVGTYAYINPIVAVFLGWLIAHEHVTPRELFGAAIILAAVIIITTASQPKHETKPLGATSS